jgi:hypothetical protein
MSDQMASSCAPGDPDYDYRASDDANTLTQAHAIRSDATRHAKAKKHATAKIAAMKAVVRSKPLGSKR